MRQTTTLSLPEELERLRAERRRGAAVVPDLEIADHAAPVAPDALEVSWRPPTKNRERIASYKARIGRFGLLVVELYGRLCVDSPWIATRLRL